MRRLSLAVLCLVAAACARSNEITIVSFNAGVFSKYEGSSMEQAASVLKGADAIALCELDSCNRRHPEFQARDFAGALGDREFRFASAFRFAGGGYGNAVVCRDRILDGGRIALPRGDGAEERCAVWVETGRYVLAATHLDHVGKLARAEQAKALSDWFREHYAGSSKPVLLCGDFNCTPDSPVMLILGQHWTRLSGDEPTYPSDKPEKCIDYVFMLNEAAPVKLLSARVLTQGTEELSDHLPLEVRISIE